MPTASGSSDKQAFVSVKSFGDFVIAATSLSRLEPHARRQVRLIAGEHLAPLATVLDVPVELQFLDLPLEGPAALFDARRLGLAAAMKSAVGLRRAIARSRHADESLVFDMLGVRERLLSFPHPVMGLPAADNIYAAYERLFERTGLDFAPPALASTGGQRVRIFAGARMAHRRPPLALLERIIERVHVRGGRAEVVLLEGERPDLETTPLPLVIVPRDFGIMLEAVRTADVIVSPDSMTAHLAEHCRKPVLVMTPAHKFYWMPGFAARTGSITLFDADLDAGTFDDFLVRHIIK